MLTYEQFLNQCITLNTALLAFQWTVIQWTLTPWGGQQPLKEDYSLMNWEGKSGPNCSTSMYMICHINLVSRLWILIFTSWKNIVHYYTVDTNSSTFLLLQVEMWERTTKITTRFSWMSGGPWRGSLKVCVCLFSKDRNITHSTVY